MNTGDVIRCRMVAPGRRSSCKTRCVARARYPLKQNARDTLNCWNFAKRETLSFAAAAGLARKERYAS